MKRTRVLLYSDGRVYGGGERYVLELARGLPKDAFDVEVVAGEEGAVDGFVKDLTAVGVVVRRLPAISTLKARGEFLKVFRFFVQNRPKILHFNLVDPRACNGAMVAAWMATRRRFIVTEHLPSSPFDAAKLPFRHRLAAHHTASTITNTEADRNVVQNRPHNRSKVVVIPNGIPDPGEPTALRRVAARAALGFPAPAGPVVGFVGALIPQKYPDLFLEGVRRVTPIRTDVRFVVIGDGRELGALQSKAAELGLDGVVRFLGHRPDARELVYGLDLLVNTSRYEGMPFTILEAMFAAVPVVAPAIPMMHALVADQASGVVFRPADGDALGQAVLGMLADPVRLRRLGAAARERALTLFSATTMCARTAEVYARR